MKTPYEKRWFCILISVIFGYFIYIDFQTHHTFNFLNVLILGCSTFLSFCPEKKKEIFYKPSLPKPNAENDLKITNTFKKNNFS